MLHAAARARNANRTRATSRKEGIEGASYWEPTISDRVQVPRR
jgi:hypothetical protein